MKEVVIKIPIWFQISKKIGYIIGILFCLILSASLVYASYYMINWIFTDHPDAGEYYYSEDNSLGYGKSLKSETDEYCKNHCSELPDYASHITQLIETESYFICLCYDKNHYPIDRSEWSIT